MKNIVIWKFRNINTLNNKVIHSLFHAIVGIIHAFRRQRNLKLMLVAAVPALLSIFLFHLTFLEAIVIIYAICSVFITELINTSLELVVDLVTREKRLKAMLAKDVAASATLVAVLQSIIIALIIIFRHI